MDCADWRSKNRRGLWQVKTFLRLPDVVEDRGDGLREPGADEFLDVEARGP